MDISDIYIYLESLIIPLYLILVYLFIQIWFLWKDVNKSELVLKFVENENFFRKCCFYVFFSSIFFMVHEIIEGTSLPGKVIFFEFFETLALVFLVLFAQSWHNLLKICAHKKTLPVELTNFSKIENNNLKSPEY